MAIKLSDTILSFLPVASFAASKSELTGINAPTGSDSEGMSALQSFLSVFGEFQNVLTSYSDLIDYDSERIKKIIIGFIISDR